MIELIPGFVQGMIRVLVSYPFDYIRTNLQTAQYKTGMDFVNHVNLSPVKAYKGVMVPLCTVPIDRSINFYIFEECKKRNLSAIYSGFISTSLCSIYFVPINHFSTKVVLSNKPVRDMWMDFKQFRSLHFFRGFAPDITRNFLASFLFMSCYGTLRDTIPKEQHNYLLFGVASSISSWTITYPLDTIRVLKQHGASSYLSIVKNNYRNLYRGFSLILMRSLPSAGVGMFAYEYTKKQLQLS
jgi:hypothetical protein